VESDWEVEKKVGANNESEEVAIVEDSETVDVDGTGGG